jgi:hypothetical protein
VYFFLYYDAVTTHIGYWWGKPEGKRPLGRRRRGGNNIKIDLREMEWDGMDWIDLAQDRDQALVNTVINVRVP